VSLLVQLPDFVPGLGTLYVDPATPPQGPFLAYDRQGNLVSSVYMLPIRDLRERKSFNDLAAAHVKTDHVDVYANNGHPGVPDPHYHVVLWYISREQAATLQYARRRVVHSVRKEASGYAGRDSLGRARRPYMLLCVSIPSSLIVGLQQI
jgi:hypothetical protein